MIFKEYNQTDIINIKNQIDRLRACGIGVADLPQNLRDSVWKIVYCELKQNGSRQNTVSKAVDGVCQSNILEKMFGLPKDVFGKKYWDMYDEASIPISPMPDIPEGCDPVSLHESAEFKSYQSGDEMPSIKNRVSDEYARKLRHAYFACVSYMDAQVGKVLDALEASGKMDNTIIILWGDHGWHLGDLRVWGNIHYMKLL